MVLISRGTCTAKMAKEVICDLLGYTVTTATSLLEEVPVELADELNERQAVVLADSSKLGVRAMNNVCSLEEIDTVITDGNSSKQMVRALEKAGVRMIVAK